MRNQLSEHLELVRTLRDMFDIEQDAAKKTRIRDAAQDLVDVVLPHAEKYVATVVANDTPP